MIISVGGGVSYIPQRLAIKCHSCLGCPWNQDTKKKYNKQQQSHALFPLGGVGYIHIY